MTTRRIHRWPIVRPLGAGGMGRVFEVVDQAGNHWALKTLPLTYEPSDAARLRREADLMRRVDHPNVARIAHIELDTDPPYLITELLDGVTLHERVADGDELATNELTDLARGLARGLVALHDIGIIHRDLTPRNVVLTGRGPCLIDFGVAIAADVTQLTQIDATPGTPAWMAPERSHNAVATAATDIYGWARLVAYAATGQVQPDAETLRSAALPAELDGLVSRALLAEPELRPTDVELAAWCGPSEEPIDPLPALRPPRNLRRTVALGAIPTLAAVTIGVVIVAGGGNDQALELNDQPSTTPLSTISTSTVAPAVAPPVVLPDSISTLAGLGFPLTDTAELLFVSPSGNFPGGNGYQLAVPGSRSDLANDISDALIAAGWAGEFIDYTSPAVTRPDGTAETSSDGYFERDATQMVIIISDAPETGEVNVSIDISAAEPN